MRIALITSWGVDVDDIREGRAPDPDVQLPELLTDRDVVGPTRERDVVDNLQRPGVHDVERVVHLVGEVVVEPFRVHGDAMRMRKTIDHGQHLVGLRIDQVGVGPGGIRLNDPHDISALRR